MKIAVSLPDKIFRQAEATAKQMRISSNLLYADAIAEFLERYRHASVTGQLNQVYSKHESQLYPVLKSAMLQTLVEIRW